MIKKCAEVLDYILQRKQVWALCIILYSVLYRDAGKRFSNAENVMI